MRDIDKKLSIPKEELMIWRVASSEKFSDTYLDICNKWSLEDLLRAIEFLDMQAALEKEQLDKIENRK